ncbi:type II toxin-antitoxin system HicA family toxin [Devosia psychrophila]|uniref:type II toxin-antitoxin system HicA family toxin n=1 Tax=Devosia psychrophila TaxID=728005 RepID=UPI000941E9B7
MKSQHENNTKKIKARLDRDGWTNVGGGNHDKFTKVGCMPIIVPRHPTVSPGVARSIAKAAGW